MEKIVFPNTIYSPSLLRKALNFSIANLVLAINCLGISCRSSPRPGAGELAIQMSGRCKSRWVRPFECRVLEFRQIGLRQPAWLLLLSSLSARRNSTSTLAFDHKTIFQTHSSIDKAVISIVQVRVRGVFAVGITIRSRGGGDEDIVAHR